MKISNKLTFVIMVAVFLFAQGLFLIPSMSDFSYADVDVVINDYHLTFDVPHAFIDPIAWTVLALFLIRRLNNSQSGRFWTLSYIIALVCLLIFFLYMMDIGKVMHYILVAGVLLETFKFWCAIILAVLAVGHAIYYTGRHNWFRNHQGQRAKD